MLVRSIPAGIQHARRWWLACATGRGKPKLAQSRSTESPHVVTNRRLFSTSSSVMDELSSGAYQGVGTLDDVITRSKNSSDVQKVALELPEVARIPSRKRTFHLDHEDLETCVRPLLSCHWHVGRVGDGMDRLQVFSLNKLFSFKDFRSGVAFFDALADVQDEESHHARVTVDYAHVYVSTHTHVAFQCISDADPDAKPVRVPGLTARDIRFAVRVEKLHETFLRDGRAITKVPADTANLQASSMEQLRRRYPTSHGQG